MNKISEEIYSQLQKLAQNSTFQDQSLNLLKQVFINLTEDYSDSQALKEDEELLFCYNILMLATCDFIRNNFIDEEIKFQLKELEFEQQFIDSYTKSYNKFRKVINENPSKCYQQISTNPIANRGLQDIHWKQNFVVASDTSNRLNQDVYYMSLQNKSGGESENKNINFKCSIEQMKDLAFQINVALESIKATQTTQL